MKPIDVIVPGPVDPSFVVEEREKWLVRMGDAEDEAAAVAVAGEHPEWLPDGFEARFEARYPKR